MGFLPDVAGTRSLPLMRDRHIVMLRREHPLTEISEIEFVAVVRPQSETMSISPSDVDTPTDTGMIVPAASAFRLF